MAYENAVRILRNEEARLWKSNEGIYDDDVVVLFWEGVEPRYLDECVRYLNSSGVSVVSGPSNFYDVNFAGNLYHLHAYYDEETQRIFRVLMRNPISYSADNWGASTTKWKLYQGDTFTHGPHSLRTLYLQNVTVEAALSFEKQTLAETYADAIYLLNGDLLSGTWHSIKRRSEVNPKTGLYTLYWFLTDHMNETLYFTFLQASDVRKGFLYRREATQTTVDEVTNATWFDADGVKYTEAGAGRYRIGGQDTLPAGWTVVNRSTRRDDGNDLLWDLDIEITWTAEHEEESAPAGAYDVQTWVEQFINVSALPAAADLAPLYDAPGKGSANHVPGDTEWGTSGIASDPLVYGLWSITRTLTGPTGTGTYQYNEETGTYSYAIVWKKTIVKDASWHVFTMGLKPEQKHKQQSMTPQQIRRRIGGDLNFDKDESTGALTGVVWNNDFSWVSGKSYPAGYCLIHNLTAGPAFYTSNKLTSGTTAPQSSADWDAIGSVPTAWITHGYAARYGVWRDYWVKSYGPRYSTSGVLPSASDDGVYGGNHPPAKYAGIYDAKTYYEGAQITGASSSVKPVVYYPTTGLFYRLKDSAVSFWTGGGVSAGSVWKVYTTSYLTDWTYRTVRTAFTPTSNYLNGDAQWSLYSEDGVFGKAPTDTTLWESFDEQFIKAKIGIRGSGVYPENNPDFKIPLVQEIYEEVVWDNDWDADGPFPSPTAPADWSAGGYESRYGQWFDGWVKSYAKKGDLGTNDSGIYDGNHSPAEYLGTFSNSNVYKGGQLVGESSSIKPVVYYSDTGLFYRLKDDAKSFWTTGSVSIGQVWKLYKSSSRADWAYYTVTGAFTPAISTSATGAVPSVVGLIYLKSGVYYRCKLVSGSSQLFTNTTYWQVVDIPDYVGSGLWSGNVSEGVTGVLPTDTSVWESFNESFIKARIGLNGVGVAPHNTPAKVGVIDGSGGYAFSVSARVSFYQSMTENPRIAELFDMQIRHVGKISLYNYFAINPHWLAPEYRRIPQNWASVAEAAVSANQATDDYDTDEILPLLINSENSNFEIEHDLVRIDGDVYAFRKVVSVSGPWVADDAAINELIATYPAGQAGKNGTKVFALSDMTGVAIKPWDGTFLDAG